MTDLDNMDHAIPDDIDSEVLEMSSLKSICRGLYLLTEGESLIQRQEFKMIQEKYR